MDSTFLEKIISKKKDKADYIRMVSLSAAYVILLFSVFMFTYTRIFFPFFAVGGGWLLWWLITGMNKEYEYTVTESFIDIDCIVARRKRFRVFSGDAKEFVFCAKVNSDFYKEYKKSDRIVLDFAPHADSPDNYFIISRNNAKKAKTKGEPVTVIFEPDERMIVNLKKYNPSKIKISEQN